MPSQSKLRALSSVMWRGQVTDEVLPSYSRYAVAEWAGWLSEELRKQHSGRSVVALHPGVVDTKVSRQSLVVTTKLYEHVDRFSAFATNLLRKR